MKFNRWICLTAVSLLVCNAMKAQQPYGGCWHPEKVKNWSPETDPDAKFNRSRVPLATRFQEPQLMKANKNQYYEGQVCNATILFPTCSLCPSQGANNFLGYQPTYWQYMDKLVYWAGSASEGIIIPPPSGSIDAAHQSGVKVLGQIFFPPYAFGGNSAWVTEMLTQEGGKYIFAKKLYEIAKYLGFEGWFINEETTHGHIAEWTQFIKEFNGYAEADGNYNMEIQWYNASSNPSSEILSSHKNTSQFLEYGSVGDYRSQAPDFNCNARDVYKKVYGGIQTVYAGLCGFGMDLRKAFPKDGHVGSVDLFCPEERIWKDNVKDYLGTPDAQGDVAYSAIKRTFENEDITWVNRLKNPSIEADTESGYKAWPGMSGCVLERSAITSLPFTTSFCVGVGKHRFVKGEKRNTQDWYHSGMQSVMPTWRWWIENGSGINPTIDWDVAYNGSNSIKIDASLTQGDHLMRLYKTQINITDGGKLRLVYKTTSQNTVEVKLGTESSVTDGLVTLTGVNRKTEGEWTIDEYDLSQVNGKTVYMVALNLKAESLIFDYKLWLGELSMLPANYQPKAMNITNFANNTTLGDNGGDLRLTWDWAENSDLDHFDVYTKNSTGNDVLVGQTRDEAFYVPKFERNANDLKLDVKLVPVMKDGSEGAAQTLEANYPQPTAPKVIVKPSKGYIKVGEKVTLKAIATGNPTEFKWLLPASLEVVNNGSLVAPQIEVRALKEGKQEITVEVTNAVGTTTEKFSAFDVLSESDFNSVANVAIKGVVKSFNGSTNNRETPANIIDGVQNPAGVSAKWCHIGTNHECVIDLKTSYRLYGFKIFDCKSGPEQNENFDKYRIYVSEDAENWTLVVDEKGRAKDNVKTDNITPTRARYVKLNPYSDEGITLRIWEFEVYGANLSNMTLEAPKELVLNANEKKDVTVKYNLNGDPRSSEFKYTVKVVRGKASVGQAQENQTEGTITFPVTAQNSFGTSLIKVVVDNGGTSKECELAVITDDPNAESVLKGMSANLRKYAEAYGYNVPFTSKTTTQLTDGNVEELGFEEFDDPCKNRQDFWAIFESPTTFNISKIKVSIPDNNMGENDNEEQALVNKDIDIMLSENGVDWRTIHTFTDIKKESSLVHYFAKPEKAKYLAVVSTLYPLSYPALSEVEVFEPAVKKSQNGIVPVTIAEGWNADIIAEARTAEKHTSQTLDRQGWVLYTNGVQEQGALCDESGLITTTAGNDYQLADFSSNNALVLKRTSETANLVFEAPITTSELYLLTICADGGGGLSVTPIYSDNSRGDVQRFNIADWFGSSEGTAKHGLGRIKRSYSRDMRADGIDGNYQFRLFEHKINIDESKQLKGIMVRSFRSGSVPTLLAVSMKEQTTTGIVRIATESNSTIVGIYTIDGLRLTAPVKGINIFKYADGTFKKVYIK